MLRVFTLQYVMKLNIGYRMINGAGRDARL